MATYLELVNKAIFESGVDLDPLTSSNFASPPSQSLYSNFKTWVSDSWNELQIDRDDFEFKTERASVYVYPALYVENGGRATAPIAGYTYTGTETGADYEVAAEVLHSGDWALGTAKSTIYFKTASEQYKFLEYFDEVLPTPASSVFQAYGRGRYDFVADSQRTDISEIHYDTLYVGTTGGSTIQTNDASTQMRKLQEVPWTVWESEFEHTLNFGMPAYFTRTPDGKLDFYPRPDEQYVLHFTYTKTQNALVLYTDTPATIPSQYHHIIAWKAAMKWASWDSQKAKYARAAKEYEWFETRLEKNQMPAVTWAPSRYDRA